MPSRIVTYVHRPKRPPRKRKAAPAVAIVRATRRTPENAPPVADEPKPTPPLANDDAPAKLAPPAAKSAVVTSTSRKRPKVRRADRPEPPDDPEADARIKAFFARMIRPP
jgi:hypothetical protein